jgi:hypothetical protein
MEKQDRRVVSLQSYRELESSCRLWMAACQARDVRLQELEQECQALRQRVARLGRHTQRQLGVAGPRQVRFAR